MAFFFDLFFLKMPLQFMNVCERRVQALTPALFHNEGKQKTQNIKSQVQVIHSLKEGKKVTSWRVNPSARCRGRRTESRRG